MALSGVEEEVEVEEVSESSDILAKSVSLGDRLTFCLPCRSTRYRLLAGSLEQLHHLH